MYCHRIESRLYRRDPTTLRRFAIGACLHSAISAGEIEMLMDREGRLLTFVGNQPTGAVERTMPLCAWPKVSKYKGTGDINSAGSFSCVEPD